MRSAPASLRVDHEFESEEQERQEPRGREDPCPIAWHQGEGLGEGRNEEREREDSMLDGEHEGRHAGVLLGVYEEDHSDDGESHGESQAPEPMVDRSIKEESFDDACRKYCDALDHVLRRLGRVVRGGRRSMYPCVEEALEAVGDEQERNEVRDPPESEDAGTVREDEDHDDNYHRAADPVNLF